MFKFYSLCLRVSLIILFLGGALLSEAQSRKGERLVSEGRYEEALKVLNRAFVKDPDDRRSGMLLIESHYMLQNYQEALDVAELMDMERSEVEKEIILYTDVLIANNDFSKAYLNLIRYLGTGASDVQAMKWLNKTGNLLDWDSIPTGSSVTELLGLNTVYNEYAPTLTENGLMYVSDHLTVQVLYPSAFTNQSLHVLYTNEQSKYDKFGRAKMLLKGREYYYHDGPIEKRPRSDFYAITLREIEGLIYDLKMNIYFTNLSGKEEDLVAFKYNGNYNTGHPTFTEDGMRMYFTSDRPGGYGQLDLWYCDWENGDWSLPKNAGPTINSDGNELYPRIRNQRLFFSSDRRDMGYGGLDIYYVSLLNNSDFPYNLRAPINSAYDDFGVEFVDEKIGYFSSNRNSSIGGDDIYEMYFQPESEDSNELYFSLEDKSGRKQRIKIYDRHGNEMIGLEGAGGSLTISGLLTRELYSVSTDSLFDESLTLVAYNMDGVKLQEFRSDSSYMKMELLSSGDYAMERAENVDESELKLFDLMGEVVSNEQEDYSEVTIILANEIGMDVKETKADSTGRFSFSDLVWDETYNISTKGAVGEVEIDIIGESGAPITTLTEATGRNSFAYTRRRPEADWMMSTEVVVPAVFGIVPAADLTSADDAELNALGDSLVRYCPTDEDGFIEMGSLTTGHAYELKFRQKHFELSDRLVILDGNGDTTQTVRPDDESSFVFEFLIPGRVDENINPISEAHSTDSLGENAIVAKTKIEGSENLSGSSTQLESGDRLKLYNSQMDLLAESYVKKNGNFNFSRVVEDSVYYISAATSKSFSVMSTSYGAEALTVAADDQLWMVDFSKEMEEEKVITLPNIYYRFDKYTLSAESTESLENLYGFLRQNPKQRIKILSHTDSRGTKAYNEELSNLRAREVVRYLIRKGIDEERLSYEGRGESSPVNECVDGVRCSNEKHAQNRRTEFVLLKN